MSDMIERVAAAIGDKVKPAFEGGKPVSLAEVARAAIEAMREPTPAIIAESWCEGWSKDVWKGLIDAALREKIDA